MMTIIITVNNISNLLINNVVFYFTHYLLKSEALFG